MNRLENKFKKLHNLLFLNMSGNFFSENTYNHQQNAKRWKSRIILHDHSKWLTKTDQWIVNQV